MIITPALIALAVLAYLGKSLVMLTSVGGMAVALWWTGRRTLARRIVGVSLGAVMASFAAEVVHVAHHIVVQDQPGHGGFWMSAFLVGLINAAVLMPLLWADTKWRRVRRSVTDDGASG